MQELILQAWRKHPPPGWPFPEAQRRLRPGPFSCLFLLIAFCLVLIVLLGIWRGMVNPSPTPAPRALGAISVGDCFSGWDPSAAGDRKQTVVLVIDCAQPHKSEYMFRTWYLSGISLPTVLPDDYPGLEDMKTDAARS